MCGILGVVGAKTDESFFLKALDRLAHRGPDGAGLWTDGEGVRLGHRRLAIIDLSEAAAQPMRFGDWVLTFNGEIYNYLEVKAELLQKGVKFTTDSDTEVLLAALEKYGPDCLRKLNGMWAFAAWNVRTHQLFLSRDRFGKKPLFYFIRNGALYFASEMKALLPFLSEISPSKNFQSLVKKYFFYETGEDCLVEGLKRFPAAHYGFFEDGKLTLSRYWNTMDERETPPPTYAGQVERFRELFLDAVRLRMRSDVALGTALSGGLDSSAIACAMAAVASDDAPGANSRWRHAFISVFPGSFLDERPYAEAVVRHTGLNAVYITPDPARAWENMSEYLYLFEEVYNTSPAPMIETYRAARAAGVVVTLDGHGADELLAGYNNTLFEALFDAGLNFAAARRIFAIWESLLPDDKAFLQDYRPWTLRQYLGYIRWRKQDFFKGVKRQLFGGKKGELGFFDSALYELFHVSILPTLLRNYDRYSMAAGVEIRAPFLDHRLVSYTFSLNWTSKLRNGYSKAILRDAIGDLLPEKIRNRRNKIGFHTPIVEWMRGAWKTPLLDLTASQDFKTCGLIDPPAVRQSVEKVIFGKTPTFSQGVDAWRELSPYLWEQAFLKRRPL